MQCNIYTLSGQLIKVLNVTSNQYQLNVDTLENGIYLMTVGNTTDRLIINRSSL